MGKELYDRPVRIEEFNRLSSLRKTVRGEVQLILHVEHVELNGKVLPYIGCSKKCCFFCDVFRQQHETSQARGTHETLFPLWALPQLLPQQSLQVLLQFAEILRIPTEKSQSAVSSSPERSATSIISSIVHRKSKGSTDVFHETTDLEVCLFLD
jgi:hypothetical protein